MATTPALEALLAYLQDEFGSNRSIRVRLHQPSGQKRSPDLEQDYDPEAHGLHRARGVTVRAGSRDYFFPAEWAAPGERARVNELIEEIRRFLGEN